MLLSTLSYARTNLVGDTYSLDESLYLSRETLQLTNNPEYALTDLGTSSGVVGKVQEAPDLNNYRTSRLVFRLTESTLSVSLQRLLLTQKL